MPPESPTRREPALITGLGAVTPLGIGIPAFTDSLRHARSGIRPLPFAQQGMLSNVAAVCHDFDPAAVLPAADLKRLPRVVFMALAAAREALEAADLTDEEGAVAPQLANRLGLVLGTGGGGIDFTLAQAAAAERGERPSMWSLTNATHGNLAGELSIHLGIRGPSLCLSTGCASASDAAGYALEQLRGDRPGAPDAWVVVGADAHIDPWVLKSMELLKVISTRDFTADPASAHAASRPFDATRDGFVLGEGAWALIIERPRFAAAREAPHPVGRLLGYAATCDAYHRVRPAPDMAESARAMRLALEDASTNPADVSLIHYHGTATELNDAAETEAVKTVFGPHARNLVGCSVKGAIGHPQGASGAAALVATLAAAADDEPFAVPTLNLNRPDPACDLDYTPNRSKPLGRSTPYRALVNCLAFGAKNSALIAETRDHRRDQPSA